MRKQSAELLDVTPACGMVYGCHRIRQSVRRVREQLEAQALREVREALIYGRPSDDGQSDAAGGCGMRSVNNACRLNAAKAPAASVL